MNFLKRIGNHGTALSCLLAVLGILLVGPVPLSAQQQNDELTPPKVEGKVIVGGANFGEEIPHGLVGAAVRIYLTERISVEPEYLFLRHSENDQDQIFQANVAYDFVDPRKKFVPYGIIGVGGIKHRGRYYDNDFVTGAPRVFDTSFTTWTASAGVGLKIYLTRRLFVAPEVRIGREPNLRGTVSVGYVFAGRK